MESICLIGFGLIGQIIYDYLEDLGYHVDVYDLNSTRPFVSNVNITENLKTLNSVVSMYDGVVAATPFNMNYNIASSAADCGVDYFDLTEDVGVTQKIRTLPAKHNVFMPQCGLAPGAVSIIAHDLTKTFDEVRDVKIRVGALPRIASNHMKYYLSWSVEGLINEYMQPCVAIVNGQTKQLEPLEGYEILSLDGCEYEAFNTSGGIGTLFETIKPTRSLTYKTIRYKGHHDKMQFLIQDLGLSKDQLVSLFRKEVPHNKDDIVIVYIEVIGQRNGRLETETYFNKFYGDDKYSAIQKSTAAGIVSVIDCYYRGTFSQRGYVPNEILTFDQFTQNKYGAMYKQQ